MKLERHYRRKAASKVMLATFLQLNSHSASSLRFNHLEWGEDLLSPKEKQYLDQLCLRIHNDAELVRAFAQRLAR